MNDRDAGKVENIAQTPESLQTIHDEITALRLKHQVESATTGDQILPAVSLDDGTRGGASQKKHCLLPIVKFRLSK